MKSRSLIGFACVLALFGCGGGDADEPTGPALDIELVPDPNINSVEQMLQQVGVIWLEVDSDDGLYPPDYPPVTDASKKNYQIKNVDNDPELELLIPTAPVHNRFPLVRLERGGLDPAKWLRIKALGFPPQDPLPDARVALGEIKGVSFGKGIQPVSLPFNLLPDNLPPRVTAVNALIESCSVSFFTINFSKPIVPDSVDGAITIDAAVGQVNVDPNSGVFADVRIPDAIIGQPPQFTIHVEVSTKVTDTQNHPLDDIPAQPGDQPFTQDIVVQCGPPITGNAGYCGDSLAVSKQCPKFFTCGADDFCHPDPNACQAIQCAVPYVCDDTNPSCVLDCRLYPEDAGICDAPKTCDESSGVCR